MGDEGWCADAEFRYFLNDNTFTKKPSDLAAAEQHKINNQVNNLCFSLVKPFLDRGRYVTLIIF